MELYSLRVKRTKAGVHFPFDRIYLVSYEDRRVLEQLFRYALVMPVDESVRSRLLTVRPETYVNRTFDRSEDAEAEMDRDWETFIDSKNWVMAVPILSKFVSKAVPRYLVAAGWYAPKSEGRGKKRTKVTRQEPFPAMTYLQTPEKKIRPVCVMCPRFILHQNGECKLGDRVCFDSLALGMKDYFKEGLAVPAPTTNIKEQDVTEVINANLQEDSSRASRVPPTEDQQT